MNNKGFTLIELLITIALLAVIATISFVSITAVIEKNKVNECNALVGNIKSSASEYISDNRYNKAFINKTTKKITAKDLIDNKYLTGPIVDPFTKESINASHVIVEYTLNANYTVNSISVTGTGDANFINTCNK